MFMGRCAAIALLAFFLQACAYGIYEDKRLLDTQAAEAALAADIKAALLKASFTDALAISVFCFYGNVFLIGEIPHSMQKKALDIARAYKPRSVTPHWFSRVAGERPDLLLAADLRSALIGAKGLLSTRIDTVVNAGRVVLLGVVHDEAEKKLAIAVARKVKGVVSVTSYLMLPLMAQKPGGAQEAAS